MNVVLVGFMASGKTAVGRRIAHRLGYGLFDMDRFIEQKVGCAITELFERKGEAYFRELESRLIPHLRELNNFVVSTGGGILTTDGNLEALRKVGLTVFLNADQGEIVQRLKRDSRRPKLKEGELEETVSRLLDERRARYSQSDLSIGTKGKSVNRVAGEIIRAIAEHGTSKKEGVPAELPADAPAEPEDTPAEPADAEPGGESAEISPDATGGTPNPNAEAGNPTTPEAQKADSPKATSGGVSTEVSVETDEPSG